MSQGTQDAMINDYNRKLSANEEKLKALLATDRQNTAAQGHFKLAEDVKRLQLNEFKETAKIQTDYLMKQIELEEFRGANKMQSVANSGMSAILREFVGQQRQLNSIVAEMMEMLREEP